jgi:hypothetical protein
MAEHPLRKLPATSVWILTRCGGLRAVTARRRMSLRAAQVRIYVDADMLGLGKILASLRNDVTYPGDPRAPA